MPQHRITIPASAAAPLWLALIVKFLYCFLKGLIQEDKSMFGKNIVRKSVTLFTVAAVWTVYSMVAFALPGDVAGEITVTGQVTVNGQPAVSNQTILSGAVISSAAG